MWPTREEKQSNARIFDRVIVADFSHLNAEVITEIKGQSNLHERIGLVQLHIYNVKQDHVVHPEIRKLIDGKNIHMLVYGEKIKTQKMVLFHPAALKYEQKYIPEIQADDIFMIVKELEEVKVPLYMKQIENHFKSPNVRVQVLK